MRPKQVAAILGLDLEDAVKAVPYDQRAPKRPNRAARRAAARQPRPRG